MAELGLRAQATWGLSLLLTLTPVVLSWNSARGPGICLEIFLIATTWGEVVATGFRWGGTRDVAEHPSVPRTAPPSYELYISKCQQCEIKNPFSTPCWVGWQRKTWEQKGLLLFFGIYHLRASFVSCAVGQDGQALPTSQLCKGLQWIQVDLAEVRGWEALLFQRLPAPLVFGSHLWQYLEHFFRYNILPLPSLSCSVQDCHSSAKYNTDLREALE